MASGAKILRPVEGDRIPRGAEEKVPVPPVMAIQARVIQTVFEHDLPVLEQRERGFLHRLEEEMAVEAVPLESPQVHLGRMIQGFPGRPDLDCGKIESRARFDGKIGLVREKEEVQGEEEEHEEGQDGNPARRSFRL
jgi:hypothetical protein